MKEKIAELRRKMESYLGTARNIVDAAVKEQRSLTDAESKDIEGLKTKAAAIRTTLDAYGEIRDLQEDASGSLNTEFRINEDDLRPARGFGREHRPGEVRVLTPKQNLVELYPAEGIDGVSLGRCLRAAVLGRGDFLSEAEARIMNEGTGAAGGFTVPTPLSARLIDMARNRSVAFRAGALTVPMDSQTLTIARLAGDPTGQWRAENTAVTASDLTFEKVVFTAKTLAALCKLSVELFEDGSNIDQVVTDALSAALALELDRASMFGSGTGAEPKGLYNYTGVQSVAAGGALTDYSKVIAALQAVYEKNGEPNAMVYSPRTWGGIEAFKDSTGQPLRAPASIDRLTKLVSNQVPVNLGSGTNESPVLLGDFSKMLIGIRTSIVVEASRQAADGTSRAFESLQVFVRAYLRADIQLAQAGHFVKVTGITA